MRHLTLLLACSLLGACASQYEPPEDFDQLTRSQSYALSDQDKDGVIDARDECAYTPPRAEIDDKGCALWETNQYVALYRIDFDFDKSMLREDQQTELNALLEDALRDDTADIAIVGDTSPEGTLAYNQDLGEERALAIATYLISNGVNKQQIRGFNFTHELVRDRLFKRQRRTIVRIMRPEGLHAQQAWHIYQAEHAQDKAATGKAVRKK